MSDARSVSAKLSDYNALCAIASGSFVTKRKLASLTETKLFSYKTAPFHTFSEHVGETNK